MLRRPFLSLALAAIAAATLQSSAAAQAPGRQTAVLAGGCFWGIQNVYAHMKGVMRVTSGYAGGDASTAQYATVSSGNTGHAESVEIIFDPALVSYTTLLKVFFTVAHDPTELNRQGPDAGTQYRSSVFYNSPEQKRLAEAFIDSLGRAREWPHPIVTRVDPLGRFYPAESYHQDYAIRHPMDPYIFINDRPKVIHLRERFPELYSETPVRATATASR